MTNASGHQALNGICPEVRWVAPINEQDRIYYLSPHPEMIGYDQGITVDLGALVSVSDPRRDEGGFSMTFQLHQKPIHFSSLNPYYDSHYHAALISAWRAYRQQQDLLVQHPMVVLEAAT